MGADFHTVVAQIKERLASNPLVVQLPIGVEEDFRGMVDLVTGTARVFDDPMGNTYETVDVPAEMADEVAEWREKLFDALSMCDEALMERYLNGEDIPVEDLKSAGPSSRARSIDREGSGGGRGAPVPETLGRRALLGDRFQGDERFLRGPTGFPPGLFRGASRRRYRAEHGVRQARARRPPPSNARQQTRGY
jgi:hypothetical protein